MAGRAATFAVGIGAALSLFSGCGGDDAPIEPVSISTDSAAAGISQTDFIAEADGRCAEANAAIANLLSSGTETPSPATIAQRLSINQGVLRGLQGIGDAEDPNGALTDYYTALTDEIRILKSQEVAASSGDTTAATSLDSELAAAQDDAESAAVAYGFEACGQSGSPLPDSTTGVPTPSAPAPSAPTTTTTAPTAPAPTTPPPVPTPPPTPPAAPPSGGTDGGTPTPPAPPDGGGSSGGVSPG